MSVAHRSRTSNTCKPSLFNIYIYICTYAMNNIICLRYSCLNIITVWFKFFFFASLEIAAATIANCLV